MVKENSKIIDLTEFGFTEKQSIVYQMGLQIGLSNSSRLARHAGIHRVQTHNILKELCNKGFATVIKRKNVSYYSMVDPDLVEEKLQEKVSKFGGIKQLLQQFGIQGKADMQVKAYHGFEGLCSMYRQRLKEGGGAKGFLGVDHIDPQMKKRLYEVYLLQRLEQGIHSKMIVSATDENKYYADSNNVPQTEVLVIPDKLFDLNAEIIMTNKKNIFIASLSSDELSGIHIQSTYLYTTMENIFDLIWRIHT